VPRVPIVVWTGLDEEALAVEAMKHGAQDYLVKGRHDGALLGRSLHCALERKTFEATSPTSPTTISSPGLVNRTLFQRSPEPRSRARPAPGRRIALMFIDLDEFKTINGQRSGMKRRDRCPAARRRAIARAVRQTETVSPLRRR